MHKRGGTHPESDELPPEGEELDEHTPPDDEEKKQKDFEDAAVFGRIFYYVFHVMINLILLLYDNDLRDEVLRLELFWPVVYISLTASSTYLFHVAKNRPGYLRNEKPVSELDYIQAEQNDYELGSHKELKLDQVGSVDQLVTASSVVSVSPKGFESGKSAFTGKKSGGLVDEPQSQLRPAEETNSEPSELLARLKEGFIQDAAIVTENDEDLPLSGQQTKTLEKGKHNRTDGEQPDQHPSSAQSGPPADNISLMSQLPPGKRFCQKCNIMQNYRSKHCKICGECVARFDHHCYFIGGCVGELNHRKFLLMLVSMQIQYFLVCQYLWSGMEVNAEDYADNHPDDPRTYTKEYGAFFMSAVVAFVASGLVALLLGYHAYLCATNETTWENISGSKIDYMSVYPSGYKPFNQGLWRNLKTFFCHNNQLRDWELPEIKETWGQPKGETWWSNQYYSCC